MHQLLFNDIILLSQPQSRPVSIFSIIGAGKHNASIIGKFLSIIDETEYFYKKHKVKRANLFEIPDYKI